MLSQELDNFVDGKLSSAPICVFEGWTGGCSYDEGKCIYRKQDSCDSPQIDIVDLLPSDPFKIDGLPLDPFDMDVATDIQEEIMGSLEGLEDSNHPTKQMGESKDELTAGIEGDKLFPGLNFLCRGTVRLLPDMGTEEPDGKYNTFPVDMWISADYDTLDSDYSHKAGLDVLSRIDETWGWQEPVGIAEGMSSFEKHICYGSGLSNIVDLLPADPFGMEAAALVCRGRVRFMPEAARNMGHDGNPSTLASETAMVASTSEECLKLVHGFDVELGSSPAVDGLRGFGESSSGSHTGEPNYALFLSLHYMGTMELLTMEKICKSMNDAVKNNPSLWRKIHVHPPLNTMLTDDALVKLTGRASGHLESLTLVGCFKITDTGITHVINTNPELAKLSVPGCFKLSIEGILKALRSAKVLALKQLRVGGLAGITNEQYEELNTLLHPCHKPGKSIAHKPLYYHNRQSYLSVDDDRAIDIEQCPRCHKVRLVYDCPEESCQKETLHPCKACILCVSRCISCGRCLTERDYVETFVLDAICFECWDEIFGSPEKGKEEDLSIFNQPLLCQATGYFCFYG